MNPREQIELEFARLRIGEHASGELCPNCKGGRTKERTLSVANEGGSLVWICHRASCGFKGRSRGSAEAAEGKPVDKPKLKRETQTDAIPDGASATLFESYGIDRALADAAGLLWTYSVKEPEGRLYMPVFNRAGVRTGFVLRSLTGAKPKVLSFTNSSEMAWYAERTVTDLVIVEDQLSAIRLMPHVSAVALLGTHLNPERVFELSAARASKLHLWLDADAFDKAIQYGLRYKCFSIRKLTKDIKNTPEPELIDILTQEGILQ
jgi:hypothetical protein